MSSVSTPSHTHTPSTHSNTPLESTPRRNTESIENQPIPTLHQTPCEDSAPDSLPTLHQTPCEDSALDSLALVSTPNSNYITDSALDSLALVSTPNSNYITESHKLSPTDIAVVDDLMFGLRPEDLSFSLNNSNISFQKPVSETGMTTVVQKMTSPFGVTDKSKNIMVDVPDRTAHGKPIVEETASNICTPVTRTLGCNNPTYPSGTFYGLPLTVSACLKEHRGIEKLYGM